MAGGTAAVIPSGDPALVARCLDAMPRQRRPLDRVVVVAWGARADAVAAVAADHAGVEVVRAGSDSGIAANRNAGLAHLAGAPPDHVAFLDDDLILDPAWHGAMREAAARGGPAAAATVVFATEAPDLVQGLGHVLRDGRPLHLGFRATAGAVGDRQPVVPCANSAFVPYDTIAALAAIEPPWDPRFRRMTCFDFGLKLRLLGLPCRVVPGAVALHSGYPAFGELAGPHRVLDELVARGLLYAKFYPPAERARAHDELAARARRWHASGYPNAPSLRGAALTELLDRAQAQVAARAASLSPAWIDRAAALPDAARRHLLLGTDP